MVGKDHAELAASILTVTSSSSNTTLVPDANVVLGGSGGNRTVTITPATGLTGTSTITLNVTQAAGPRAKQLGNSAALQVSGKVRVQAWACGASTGNAAPTLYLRQLHVSGSPHNFGSTTTTTGP